MQSLAQKDLVIRPNGKRTSDRFAKTISCEIPKTRKRRPKNIASRFIPLASNKNDRTEAAILHKHLCGSLLITLNARYEPLVGWSDSKAYMPIKCRYVEASRFRDIVERERPRRVYMNDGVLLAPLDDAPFEIEVYTCTLNELLERLRREVGERSEKPRIPRYEEVRALDANISLSDYQKIYCMG